jgi:FCD domain
MARGQFLPLPGRLVKGADEHYDIIEAVIAGDPVVAERITRDHFLSVIAALRQLEEVTARRPASHSDHGQSRSRPPLVARLAAPFSTSAAELGQVATTDGEGADRRDLALV